MPTQVDPLMAYRDKGDLTWLACRQETTNSMPSSQLLRPNEHLTAVASARLPTSWLRALRSKAVEIDQPCSVLLTEAIERYMVTEGIEPIEA